MKRPTNIAAAIWLRRWPLAGNVVLLGALAQTTQQLTSSSWTVAGASAIGFFVWVTITASRRRSAMNPLAICLTGGLLGVSIFGELRIAAQLALAGIATAGIPFRPRWLLRFSALGWFSALPLVTTQLGIDDLPVRLGLLSLALLVFIADVTPSRPRIKRWSSGAGWVRPISLGARYFAMAAACTIVIGGLLGRWGGDGEARRIDFRERGLLYSSTNVQLAPSEATQFASVDVVKRRVRTASGEFDLLVVDGTRNRHAVHVPTVCHLGDGWEPLASRPFEIDGGAARWVRMSRRGVTTECVYWFSDQEHRSASPWWYWSATTLRRLTGGRSGSEPVLVVLTQATESPVDWENALAAFTPARRL